MSVSAASNTERCFLVHAADRCEQQPKVLLRLMGRIVHLNSGINNNNSSSNSKNNSMIAMDNNNTASAGQSAQNGVQLILDDGTATLPVVLQAPRMARRFLDADVPLGQLVECLVRYQQQPKLFVVEQVALVDDLSAELLRWLELSTTTTSLTCLPTADDVLEVIQLEKDGVSLEDLAVFFGISDPGTMEEDYIVDLQQSGQVYRTPQGLYVPL